MSANRRPIDFGASFRIVRDAAWDVGTYCELRDIQRLERGWHREALVQLADAIAERHENARLAKVGAALRLLEDHGAIMWTDDRDAAIDAATASRPRQELDVVVPRSAFRDIHELAEHIAERISLKTTTRTYDELLERTGGKKTIRVRNIEAQREALPLRRVYEADVVEPLRALQLDRVDQAREVYQERKGEIALSGLSMENRLEDGRDALRAMRTAVPAYRELRPQLFGEWLQEREQRGAGPAVRRSTGRARAGGSPEAGRFLAGRGDVAQPGGSASGEGRS